MRLTKPRTLRARRAEGASEQIARLDTLLSIMAGLDDTCLLYRGGASALRAAKSDGHAMGVAMKHLKSAGAVVESAAVQATIKSLRDGK